MSWNRRHPVHLVLLCLSGSVATFAQTSQPADDLPPVEKWIRVNSVPDEYEHIRRHFKTLGESYRINGQAAGERGDRQFDQIEAISETTGQTTIFVFDTTEMWERTAQAQSPNARKSAHEALQTRYPKITPALLPELKLLLRHKDVHHRTWAVAAVARIPTEEARGLLVDGLINTSIFTDIESLLAYEAAAKQIGASMATVIAQRLPKLGQQDRWDLVSVLGDIGDSHACSIYRRRIAYRSDTESAHLLSQFGKNTL